MKLNKVWFLRLVFATIVHEPYCIKRQYLGVKKILVILCMTSLIDDPLPAAFDRHSGLHRLLILHDRVRVEDLKRKL